jgi:hypothetical protein
MAINGIDTQLVTVTVDEVVNGTAAGSPTAVQCVLDLGNYKQSRAKKTYACMSSNESTVGLGSITRDPLTLGLLYNEDNTDGQKKLKDAFNNNSDVDIVIEFNNTPGGGVHGTQISARMGVAEWDMAMPKDSKIELTFSLEFKGAATIIEAA